MTGWGNIDEGSSLVDFELQDSQQLLTQEESVSPQKMSHSFYKQASGVKLNAADEITKKRIQASGDSKEQR